MQEKDTIPAVQDVCVLAESEDGQFSEASLELVSRGLQIAQKLKGSLNLLAIGFNSEQVVDPVASCGVSKIFLLNSPVSSVYLPEYYIRSILALIKDQKPALFVSATSNIGNEIMTGVAVRLKTGLVKDCVGIEVSDKGVLTYTKPLYGNKVYGTINCSNCITQMATFKTGSSTTKLSVGRRAEIVIVTPEINNEGIKISRECFIPANPATIDIDEADIIVAGGRGVGSAEKFHLLEELAASLGGSVASSMIPADEGWVSKNKMVGQTGVTVSPKLYIACGISGASHHVLGMKDSRIIIAINTDKYAPIFKIADIKVVGNLSDLLPIINKKLQERSANSNKKNDGIKNNG